MVIAAFTLAAALAGCGDPAYPPIPEPSGTTADPVVTCLGVAPAKCRDLVREIQAANPDNLPVAVRIVCTAVPCTEQAGQVSIDLLAADGMRSSSGTGWATAVGGGGPVAPVPLLPTPPPESGPP